MIILGLAQTSRVGAAQVQQADQHVLFTGESVAQSVGEYLDLRAAELEAVARQVEASPDLDPAALETIVVRRRVLSGHLAWLGVADHSSVLIASDPSIDSTGRLGVGQPIVKSTAYAASQNTGVTTLGWPEHDPATNQPTLRILTPAWTAGGTRLGLVDAYLNLHDMQDLVQRAADLSPGLSISIVDENGQLLADSSAAPTPGTLTDARSIPLYAPLTRGQPGAIRLAADEQGALVRAAGVPVPVPGLQWTVIAGLPESVVQANAWGVQRDTVAVAGVALLTALALAAFLAHVTAQPILLLAEVATAVGRGEAPSRPLKLGRWKPAEVHVLFTEFTAMISRVVERREELESEVASRTAALQASESHSRLLIEHGSDVITVLEADGRIQYASPSVEHVLGYPLEQVVGLNVFNLVHRDDIPRLKERFQGGLRATRQGLRVEFRIRHADGSWRVLEGIGSRLPGSLPRMVVNCRDISDRKRDEASLERLALFDSLTGLPNRALLQDRLDSALRIAERTSSSVAVLQLDLDRFKEVNDTLGHQAGDQLLVEVGGRMAGALRDSDTLARSGGDEFVAVLPATNATGALAVAHQLGTLFDHTFLLDGNAATVGVSIGIAVYPEHGRSLQDLFRHADTAMYVSKRDHHGPVVYSAEQDVHSEDRLAMTADLRRDLEAGKLELYYQPKAVLGTGLSAGVEALLRWRRDEKGFVSPDVFIPIAEETGLIHALTRWVLKTALAQSRAWEAEGLDVLVSVNLSMRNLHDPNLLEDIAALLAQFGVPANHLQVEVTENSLMVDPRIALEVLKQLRGMGVRISIDDYGTGYSSLAYLKRLPVDELKIDKAFISHLCEDDNDAIIVQSTIGMGHAMGLTIVAEGIEDRATLDQLREAGCDVGQGFFLARPLPAAQATAHLRAEHQAALAVSNAAA